MMYIRSSVFWVVTQRMSVFLHRYLGAVCPSHLQSSSSLTLEDGKDSLSETSINKYQHTLRNNQEERWRQFGVISTVNIEAKLYRESSINTCEVVLCFEFNSVVRIYVWNSMCSYINAFSVKRAIFRKLPKAIVMLLTFCLNVTERCFTPRKFTWNTIKIFSCFRSNKVSE